MMFEATNMPADFTDPAVVPAVLISGTAAEADHFLVNALWPKEGSIPSVATVIAWQDALQLRGEEFASHVSACRFWLYEQKDTDFGSEDEE
jgi:hypothetical protein